MIEDASAINRPHCPSCGAGTNMYGQPLVSEWAVTTHLAGKIRAGDSDHRKWAQLHAPEVDYSVPSVPTLANQLLPVVQAKLRAARESARRATATPLDLLYELEITLHEHIRQCLERHYGTTEEGWWVQGIPLSIRQECVMRREADSARDEPFAYTFLIDLKTIVEKRWPIFEAELDPPRGKNAKVSKSEITKGLDTANEVRNRYAHAPRAPKRGSAQYDKDLHSAGQLLDLIRKLTRNQD